MEIKKAVYKTSVVSVGKIINDDVPEFAFVGRSNVGKSTLINYLTGNKKLAKASSTPGKTKMINYFDINDKFRFVDLPGYGFAKTGKQHQEVWSSLLGKYLVGSNSLLTVFILLDIRRDPNDDDKQMIEFLVYNDLPFKIILTKADKLSKSQYNLRVKNIASSLKVREEIFIVTSSSNGTGKEKVLDFIENKLSL